jgi:hypothetical protein
VAGKFAIMSRDAQGPCRALLIGGTELAAEDFTIKTPRAAYGGNITSVRYDERELTVDQRLPMRLLVGQVAQIGADRNLHAFRISEVVADGDRTRVRHEKGAKYFQSTVVNVDEKAGTVEGEIEPVVFGCDPEFATGTTVTNESQGKFWRATLAEGDRWMHLGHPGYRGSFPNKVAMSDFPDSNGDGRRTVRLLGAREREDQDEQKNSLHGKVLTELEVTRVTPDGKTFYFRLPKDEKFRRGGWEYAYRLLVNEDGSRKWTAKYPGSSILWRLQGGFKAGDFTDADGDGKIKMSACLFGPGDRIMLDTAVCVTRDNSPGVYAVRSNVPCTIGLPRGEFTKVEISADGKTFTPLAAKADGARLVVELAEKDLADGGIVLRLGR